jgi:hypothetical protein
VQELPKILAARNREKAKKSQKSGKGGNTRNTQRNTRREIKNKGQAYHRRLKQRKKNKQK